MSQGVQSVQYFTSRLYLKTRQDSSRSVTPANLFSFEASAGVVRDPHFIDTTTFASHLGNNLRLKPKRLILNSNALDGLSSERFLAAIPCDQTGVKGIAPASGFRLLILAADCLLRCNSFFESSALICWSSAVSCRKEQARCSIGESQELTLLLSLLLSCESTGITHTPPATPAT
jgi:hypothetical protein